MLNFNIAALFGRGPSRDLAESAPPDTPVQPHREDGRAGRHHPTQPPPAPGDPIEAGAPPDSPVPARSDHSSEWVACPCGEWGVSRDDRHGCAALCKELFPELDQELDAWERAYGWLYR